MPRGIYLPLLVALLLWPASCKQGKYDPNWYKINQPTPPPTAAKLAPAHIKGTIGEVASIARARNMNLAGYGVVIALGNTGSTEVPPVVERYLSEYLRKVHKLASPIAGTEDFTPARILHTRDSAVVIAAAAVPVGAPAGWRFDLDIAAMPATETTSLSGGHLMPVELFLAPGGVTAPPTATVPRLGEGVGSTFVNPFIDPTNAEQALKLRQARVIGGGVITKSIPIRLTLNEPDHGMASAIQRRINDRFRLSDRAAASDVPSERVANATSPSTIEVRVPPAFRDEFVRFADLVMHLPVTRDPAAMEEQSRELAKAIEMPSANHEEIALVWEAIGRLALPVVQGLYASKDPTVAYYAARTGLRLGDSSAGELVGRYAANANSPLRLAAIAELGRHADVSAGLSSLRALLDDPNEAVALAAYESLARRRDWTTIQRTDLDGMIVDRVKSKRAGLIYATQMIEQRVAIFGDLPVQTPVFFASPDDLVTIDAKQVGGKLTVYRKIPHTGAASEPFQVEPTVADLVAKMGQRPDYDADNKIKGMGLTYGQIVTVLHLMCKEHDIQGRLVLQSLPEATKMYQGSSATGRPDAPAEETTPPLEGTGAPTSAPAERGPARLD
jgi:flagellar basal body P-ring protein FlgI